MERGKKQSIIVHETWTWLCNFCPQKSATVALGLQHSPGWLVKGSEFLLRPPKSNLNLTQTSSSLPASSIVHPGPMGPEALLKHTLCLQLHPMLLLSCFLNQDCLSSLKKHFIYHPRSRFLRSVLMLLVRINISPLQAFMALISFSVLNMMIISFVLQTAAHTSASSMRF